MEVKQLTQCLCTGGHDIIDMDSFERKLEGSDPLNGYGINSDIVSSSSDFVVVFVFSISAMALYGSESEVMRSLGAATFGNVRFDELVVDAERARRAV